MVDIVLRAGKGSPLTNAELDANFTNLKVAVEAASGSASWAAITGKPTTLSGFGITDAQALLVSGTNIKTVNGQSVLGSGNIYAVESFNGRTGTVALAVGDVTTALGYTPVNKAGDTFTGSVATSNAGGFTANSAAKLWTDSSRGRLDLYESSAQTKSLRVMNANGYGIVGMTSAENLELWTNGTARVTIDGSTGVSTFASNAVVNAGADSRVLVQSNGTTVAQLQATATDARLHAVGSIPLTLWSDGVKILDLSTSQVTINNRPLVSTNTITASSFIGSAAGLTGLKTINGTSILGSGDIVISGGSGGGSSVTLDDIIALSIALG